MRRSRTAAIGMTHALTPLFVQERAYKIASHKFTPSPMLRQQQIGAYCGGEPSLYLRFDSRLSAKALPRKLGTAAERRDFPCGMFIAKGGALFLPPLKIVDF